MSTRDLAQYGPAIADVLAPAPGKVMELTFGRPDAAMQPKLAALTLERAFEGRTVRDRDMAQCVVAGLWLLHDFMDESHNISQEIDTPSGSYWHAILHRREPDYANAKYWFRRVGEHAIFPALRDAAVEEARNSNAPGAAYLVTQSAWDAFKFVDLCATAESSTDDALRQLCLHVQMHEFRLLFDHCYRAALK